MEEARGRHAGRHMSETLRRAAIVKRYVAIEKPDAETDAAFAAELGLSFDSLIRMATAWRRTKDVNSLQGSHFRPSDDDRLAALEALSREPDLRQVPASRRDEIRKRLRAVRRFLKIREPDARHWAKAAAELGISPRQFAKLVRAWVIHQSPMAVPGAHAAKRPHRKNTTRRDAIAAAIRQALDELGREASGIALHRRAVALCEGAGVAPPAQQTTYSYLNTLRNEGRPGDDAVAASSD